MSFLSVTVANDEKTVAKLKRLPAVMRPIAVRETAHYLVEFGGGYALRWYPPARPQSSYTRTYKLQNDWKYTSGQTSAVITNRVPYAPFPMGDPPAAKMRLLGWRGAMERVQGNLSRAVAYARQKVMQAIGSL